MNSKALLTLLMLMLCVRPLLQAQNKTSEHIIIEAKNVLQEAVTYGDRDHFLRAKRILEPLTTRDRLSALAHYYLGYIDYQMAVVVERMDKDRSVAYLDSAVEHLEMAIERDERFAEAYALLASCYGMKIGHAPLKGIILGPKSASLMSKAKSLAPDNPRVALLDAIGTYNTPALFGGGRDKGLAMLKHAAELFDRWKEPDSLQPSWGKEEVYAWIGIAHMKRKENMLAKRSFERALEINPRYRWVKDILIPQLEKQVQSQQ